MKRKDYREPTMQVVQLQQTGMLMTSEHGQAGLQNYSWHTVDSEVKASRNYNVWDDDWSKD